MPRFQQRPTPPEIRMKPAPGLWCTRCGRTRHAFKIERSTRSVYACPAKCDEYDPAGGRI